MPTFRFTARGRDGHPVAEMVEAATADEARRKLDAMGLTNIRLLGDSPHPFVWVSLTVGQVVSVLGCAASVLTPFWYLAAHQESAGDMQAPRASLGWEVLVVLLGTCIGFFYSAGMLIVFSRVKRMK